MPRGRGRGWAESTAGIDYALGQIANVARGQRGRQAINSIVRRFERPRDPGGEVAGAIGALGSFRAGGGPALPSPAAPGPTANPNIQALISQRLLSGLGTGQQTNWLSLARLAAQRQTAVAARAGKPEDLAVAAQFGGQSGKGGWIHPVTGKIIGTPGAGTHTLGNWESDRALDISVPVGTPVYSPFGGVIGSQFGSLGMSGRFQGLRLHVANPTNEYYGAHLSRYAPGIKPGRRVRAGQLLGYSGSASGVAHLHEATKYGDPYRLAR